jgi:membrane associated rhomboid family serine protease
VTFSLRDRPSAIVLEANGLHLPSGARGGGMAYSAYADITHLSTSTRSVWIGTRHSVYVVGRKEFDDPHGPENVVRALLERIAGQPDGSRQLARMAEIEEISRYPGTLYATWGLAIICVVVYALQLFDAERINAVGYFTGALALDGDWWRAVTANLLHGNPLHLALNVVALLGLGSLVERALGTPRTVCIMAVSAAMAMAASGVASPIPVVGVSGVVFGLLGALFWLEFRFADALPAWWRVPRRGLYWMLGISLLLSLLPFIAGAAHLGGFVGGGVSLGSRRPSPRWVRAFALGSLAVSVAAVGTAGYMVMRPGEYVTRLAERLHGLADATPEELNNVAWIIAVDPDSDRALLELALRLTERAVEESGRTEPHILDTLAEVHFQLGDQDAAVAAIEEAILLKPDRDYYQEQKRRFLGEREAEDRPFYDPRQDSEEPSSDPSQLRV